MNSHILLRRPGGWLASSMVVAIAFGFLAPARLVAGEPENGARASAKDGNCQADGDQAARLISGLKSDDPKVRRQAASALAELGDLRALEPLLDLHRAALEELMRGEQHGKYAGMDLFTRKAILAIKDPGAVEPLVRHLAAGEEIAAEALGEIGDSRAVAPLAAALQGRQRGLRRAAIVALGKIKDPRAVEPLLAVLEDPDPAMRVATAGALVAIGDPRAVEPLTTILRHDGDPDNRVIAARALGRLDDRRARDALQAALNDRDPSVRRAASQAINEFESRRNRPAAPGDSAP